MTFVLLFVAGACLTAWVVGQLNEGSKELEEFFKNGGGLD